MAKIVLTTETAAAVHIARSAVKGGQVFKALFKDGSLGKNTYVDVGHNGRHYSLNVATGALSGTSNRTKKVVLTGRATVRQVIYLSGDVRRVTTPRGNVKSGEIFKSGSSSYIALGQLKDGRRMAINMADPFNEDYAVTENASRNVQVIGHAEFHVVAYRK